MKPTLASGFALPSPPKRTAVAPETAATFAEADEPSRVRMTTPKASKLRRAELGERTVVYLPSAIATDLRVHCARDRRSLSDAVTAAVTMWLQAQGTKGT